MFIYMKQENSVWNWKAQSGLWGQGKATGKGGNNETERKTNWGLEIVVRETHAKTLC